MCGIAGGFFSDKNQLTRMTDAIVHRGPDSQGLFVDEQVSLGHRRLSVLDVSDAGTQPMWYSKNKGACSEEYHPEYISESSVCLVFNGEIYNYLEIQSELSALGYIFSTDGDSEVLLAAYVEWGEDCVQHFNGMWSFCVYDKVKQTLFCSRDRMGVKPFYYCNDAEFVFASEMAAILAVKDFTVNDIDTEATELYFSMGFVPAPYSIFSTVRKLPAAHNLRFDLRTREIVTNRYWELPVFDPVSKKSQEWKDEFESIMQSASMLRMRSDVSVGAMLSGGLDSTTVVAHMKHCTDLEKLHTFSIGFPDGKDETPLISVAAEYFKTQHHHNNYSKEQFIRDLDDMGQTLSEPFADQSIFPTRFLCSVAKKEVTVLLSGDGGDEIFGGYGTHVMGRRLQWIQSLPWVVRAIMRKQPFSVQLSIAASIDKTRTENFWEIATVGMGYKSKSFKKFTQDAMVYALERADGNTAEAFRIYDMLYQSLPDHFCTKVDRASMHHSVEVRSPFLDYRFAELSQTIPTREKVDLRGRTKIRMRDWIQDKIPHDLLYAKKQGFSPPLNKWMNEMQCFDLNQARDIVGQISPDVALWFSDAKLADTNEIAMNYKMRLVLFMLWYQTWINK